MDKVEKMHYLLIQQLLQIGLENIAQLPQAEEWEAFLQTINQTYHEIDKDRYLMGRMLEMSSQKMKSSYENLVKERDHLRHDLEQSKLAENQLSFQATHDLLTDLPNRILLRDRIDRAIYNAKRESTQFGILFLDLDNFKMVNDHLSHAIGDTVLKIVAKRLARCSRKFDTIARFGGDEFVLVSPPFDDFQKIILWAQRITNALDSPFKVGGHSISITGSVGISIYPKDGKTIDDLLKHADIAMYKAKETSGSAFKFFDEIMNKEASRRLFILYSLPTALEKNQFQIVYQPIIDCKTQHIIGAEALLRWQHPKLGFIQPKEFIPLAEENGTIKEIGQWVLRQACQLSRTWMDQGFKDLFISVNISARQLNWEQFSLSLAQILQETQLPPQNLELEITENVFVFNINQISVLLQKAKDLGVNITIDDFGTGYSSLSFLKHAPLNKIKIDQLFTQDIGKNKNTEKLIIAIIKMTKSLGLRVLAEGIETAEQLAFIQKHLCQEAQGFYFSKPLSAEECTVLIKQKKPIAIQVDES